MYTNSATTSMGELSLTVEQPEIWTNADGTTWVTLRWQVSDICEEVEVFVGDTSYVPSYFGTDTEYSCEIPEDATTFRVVAFLETDEKVAVDGPLFGAIEEIGEPPFFVTNAEDALAKEGSFAWAMEQAVEYEGSAVSSISIDTAQAGTSFTVYSATAVEQPLSVVHDGSLVALNFSDTLYVEQGGQLYFASPVSLKGQLILSKGELIVGSGSILKTNATVTHGAILRLFGNTSEVTCLSSVSACVNVYTGSTLAAGTIAVEEGAQLTLHRGSILSGDGTQSPVIEVRRGELNSGILSMVGVDLNGAVIDCHGNVTLTDCSGMATLNLCCGYVKVTGCDLSQVSINLISTPGHESDSVFDFSDNFWGTTDIEEIKSRIIGYDESRITIGDPSDSLPAPTLNEPKISWAGEGCAYVTFSWESSGDYEYELQIADDSGIVTTECSYTCELSDGIYSYTLTATDANGNSVTVNGGSFEVNSADWQVSLLPVETHKLQEGLSQVTFSWNTFEGQTYEFSVDGEMVWQGTEGSYTTTLVDGSFSYGLWVTDAQGNVFEADNGLLELDSVAPEVTFFAPEVHEMEEGMSEVFFTWLSNEECIYELVVDGAVVYLDAESSFSIQLADGVHTYSLAATDRGGNVTRVEEYTLELGPQPAVFEVTRLNDGTPDYLGYEEFCQQLCGLRLLLGALPLDITPLAAEGSIDSSTGAASSMMVSLTSPSSGSAVTAVAQYEVLECQTVDGTSVPARTQMVISLASASASASDTSFILYALGQPSLAGSYTLETLVLDMSFTEQNPVVSVQTQGYSNAGGAMMPEVLSANGAFTILPGGATEGSLAWALEQAMACEEGVVPTILFDASMDGQVIAFGASSGGSYNLSRMLRLEAAEGTSVTLDSESFYLSSGGGLTLGQGVNVIFPEWSTYCYPLICEGNNHIWFKGYRGGLTDEGCLSLTGAEVDLSGTVVHGSLDLNSVESFRADGVHFAAPRALSVSLVNWDGVTAPEVLAGITNCTAVEGAYIAYSITGLGGNTVTWDDEAMSSLLVPEGLSGLLPEMLYLLEGDTFIHTNSTEWKTAFVSIDGGAVFHCCAGTRYEAVELYEYSSSSFFLLRDGAVLEAEDAIFCGTVAVAPGAVINGTPHFEVGSALQLEDWVGSTEQLGAVFTGEWTTDSPLDIKLPMQYVQYEGGTIEFVQLEDARFGSYIVAESDCFWVMNGSAIFHEGVDLTVGGAVNLDTASRLVFEGNNVVRHMEGSPGAVIDLWEYGDESAVLEAHGTRFEVPVKVAEGSSVVGEDIVFAAEVPVMVSISSWDGSVDALQAILSSALEGATYTFGHEAPVLGISCYDITFSGVLSEETLATLTPEGFSNLYFPYLDFWEGNSITVAAGTTLNMDYAYIEDGTLRLEEGALLKHPLGGEPLIRVDGGNLELEGTDLSGAIVEYYGGSGNLTGCYGSGALYLLDDVGSDGALTVTGCDFSQMTVVLGRSSIGDTVSVGSVIYDLSGNYWGTTDLETIKSKIEGYDESCVILGDILTSSPVSPEKRPLTLTLLSPATQKLAEGSTQVTLSWSAENATSYELTVEGKVVYTGTETKHTLTLADGKHSWSVKAVDASGNATTATGSELVLDATAPTLTLSEPATQKLAEGSMSVTLSWSAEAGATCELTVDGKVVYTGTETKHTLTLADGKHSWSVKAVDAAGNATTATGSELVLDATAPTLKLSEPATQKLAEGSTQVTLSWSAEAGATCELMVDGKVVYTGTETKHTLTLADGKHSWSVKAVDASGNATTATGSELVLDATAPTLTLSEPVLVPQSDGQTQVTLSWSAEAGATCELTVDGKVVYTGTAAKYTLTLPEGKHSWSLKATDAAGNAAKATGDSFTLESAAEVSLSLLEPEFDNPGKGKTSVTFSWSGAAGQTYVLTVDGKDYNLKGAMSKTIVLKDGEHSYSVTATDSRGNSITEEGESFTLDTVAPVLKLDEPQLGESFNGLTPVTFSWSANESSVYELEVNGEVVYTGEAAHYAISLPDDSYTFSVKALDDAGNATTAAGKDFTLDSEAPELTLNDVVVKPSGKGKAKVTFSWQSGEAATYVLTVDGKDYNIKNKTTSTLTLADGEHSWSLTATDAYGNSTTVDAGESFVTDTLAPTMGNFAVESVGVNGRGEVTLSWDSNDPDAIYQVTLDGAVDYEFTTTEPECSLEDMVDGKFKVTITATDAYGNTSMMKNNISLDFTAPKLELKSPAIKKQKTEGSAQVTLSWKGESKVTYTVELDGEVVYEGTKTSLKLVLEDGEHSYTVTATDPSGNSAVQEGEFSVDTTAPELQMWEPQPVKVGESRMDVTFNWLGEEGASYLLKVDGKKYTPTGTSFTLENLKDGKHKYELTATDAAGNKVTIKDSFTYDATAPKLTLKKPKLSSAPDYQFTAKLSWSGEKGATYTVTVDGTSYDVGSSTSFELALLSGEYTYSVTAQDAAGNTTVKEGEFSMIFFRPTVLFSLEDTADAADAPALASASLDHELGLSAGLLSGAETSTLSTCCEPLCSGLETVADELQKQSSFGTLA